MGFLGFTDPLRENLAAVPKTAFAEAQLVHQLCSFLDWLALQRATCALVTWQLNYCKTLYVKLPLKSTRKLQLVQNEMVQARVMGLPQHVYVSLMLHKFWVWFKVLIIACKALYCMRPDYLRDWLVRTVFAWPVWSNRMGIIQVPSIKQCYLLGHRKYAFSVRLPPWWWFIRSWKLGYSPSPWGKMDVTPLFLLFCVLIFCLDCHLVIIL